MSDEISNMRKWNINILEQIELSITFMYTHSGMFFCMSKIRIKCKVKKYRQTSKCDGPTTFLWLRWAYVLSRKTKLFAALFENAMCVFTHTAESFESKVSAKTTMIAYEQLGFNQTSVCLNSLQSYQNDIWSAIGVTNYSWKLSNC